MLRRGLLRLEGCFWLTRPQSVFSKVPMALAAWTIGRGGGQAVEPARIALLVAILVALQSAMFVVNDILDAPRDHTSAPYLPIPSGVVGRRAAVAEALLLGAAFVAGTAALSATLGDFAAVLATLPAAFLTMKVYGRTKSAWYSPLLASTASSSAPAWAWLLAGHHDLPVFAGLFGIASLHGVHANLRAQLRDIEGDPRAGNVTLAVRLGARRTFWLAAVVRILELAAILGLALCCGRPGGALWLLPAAALLGVGLATARRVYTETRERLGQTAALALWVDISFLTEIAVLGAFQPWLALPTAVGMFLWYKLVRRAYYRRLVGGRLAMRWHDLEAPGDADRDPPRTVANHIE
jgi:4-hydroxybenzoate polyprenyltransferase